MIRFRLATAVEVLTGAVVLACSGSEGSSPVAPADAGSAADGSISSASSPSGSGDATLDSAADAVSDAGSDVMTDAFVDVVAPDAGPPCPANVPLTSADLDKEFGWKPALKAPGACSAGDLTTLQNNLTNPAIKTYLDLGTGLSATCKACAITLDTATSWGPIVATESNNGMTGFINFGACYGSIEGDACGKSLQYEQFCYGIACNECSSTATARQQCVKAASEGGGMCAAFGAATGTSCPNIQTTAIVCNGLIEGVKTLCGS